MKKSILTCLLLCCALAVFANGIKWLDSLPQAVTESQKTKKPILMFFTGSDWCGYCIQMDKNAFSKPSFQKFIQDNFVMLKLDFPRKTKLQPGVVAQNREQAEKYKVRGYPTVVITDAAGKELARTGFIKGDEKAYKADYERILSKIKK